MLRFGGCVGARMTEQAVLGCEDVDAAVEADIRISGVVKWFDAVRGYGFVMPDDGSSDILVHFTVVREAGRRTMAVN